MTPKAMESIVAQIAISTISESGPNTLRNPSCRRSRPMRVPSARQAHQVARKKSRANRSEWCTRLGRSISSKAS